MREIKFRAWDGEKMVDVDSSRYWLGQNGCVFDYVNRTEHEWKIMQYTGLKDNNGKEIYEGDIVTCNAKNSIKWSAKGRVEFINGQFAINVGEEPAVDDDSDHYAHFWSHDNFEIIGNIYENSSLSC
jgi:uncharacterized phage protein (TIGR01671 family)